MVRSSLLRGITVGLGVAMLAIAGCGPAPTAAKPKKKKTTISSPHAAAKSTTTPATTTTSKPSPPENTGDFKFQLPPATSEPTPPPTSTNFPIGSAVPPDPATPATPTAAPLRLTSIELTTKFPADDLTGRGMTFEVSGEVSSIIKEMSLVYLQGSEGRYVVCRVPTGIEQLAVGAAVVISGTFESSAKVGVVLSDSRLVSIRPADSILLTVTAEEIWQSYQKSAQDSAAKYHKRKAKVSGVVCSITTRGLKEIWLSGSETGLVSVRCDKDLDIAAVRPGQAVTVSGELFVAPGALEFPALSTSEKIEIDAGAVPQQPALFLVMGADQLLTQGIAEGFREQIKLGRVATRPIVVSGELLGIRPPQGISPPSLSLKASGGTITCDTADPGVAALKVGDKVRLVGFFSIAFKNPPEVTLTNCFIYPESKN